jgi:hypothetical protein
VQSRANERSPENRCQGRRSRFLGTSSSSQSASVIASQTVSSSSPAAVVASSSSSVSGSGTCSFFRLGSGWRSSSMTGGTVGEVGAATAALLTSPGGMGFRNVGGCFLP